MLRAILHLWASLWSKLVFSTFISHLQLYWVLTASVGFLQCDAFLAEHGSAAQAQLLHRTGIFSRPVTEPISPALQILN